MQQSERMYYSLPTAAVAAAGVNDAGVCLRHPCGRTLYYAVYTDKKRRTPEKGSRLPRHDSEATRASETIMPKSKHLPELQENPSMGTACADCHALFVRCPAGVFPCNRIA